MSEPEALAKERKPFANASGSECETDCAQRARCFQSVDGAARSRTDSAFRALHRVAEAAPMAHDCGGAFTIEGFLATMPRTVKGIE
jgi:hypothetical protein